MKRIWYSYDKWEDWKSGLYLNKKPDNEIIARSSLYELFSNQDLFFHSGIKMMHDWKISTDYNLSNTTSNRKSYLGQAIACYLYGYSMSFTAKVFTELDKKDQLESNKTAEKLIRFYEEKIYNENHPNIVRGKNEKLS